MSRPLRVAMVLVTFPTPEVPHRGIFNLRAALQLRELVELRVVRLRTWLPGRPRHRRYEVEGIPVDALVELQLPGAANLNRRLFYTLGWRRLEEVLKGCDLIHSVGAETAGVLASMWARRAGVRHLAQVIGSDVYSVLPNLRLKGELAGWHRHLQGVAAVCGAVAARFRELYPSVPNVRTIYRGTDLDRFNPCREAQGPLSGWGAVRFFYLGGFPPHPKSHSDLQRKGGRLALEAWLKGEDELVGSGASLALAGKGAEETNPVVSHHLKRLKHRDAVHLAGPLLPEDIPGYIRAADVVLVPSTEEGLPNVAVEAAACGRAVFGGNVGGMKEIVLGGETGLMLPPGNVDALCRALVEFSRRADDLREMGRRAREHAERHFDGRRFAPQMLELYQTVMGEPIRG